MRIQKVARVSKKLVTPALQFPYEVRSDLLRALVMLNLVYNEPEPCHIAPPR